MKRLTTRRTAGGLALIAAAAVALAGCSSSSNAASSASPSTSASGATSNCKTLTLAQAQAATSDAAFGGLDCLAQAADAEGHLNVITLPPSWANYGKIISAFEAQYPQIKINSENPNGSSADEVAAAKADAGQSTDPDVFDIGTAVMDQNLNLFTPYKVANWSQIPADFKDPSGLWWYDYTGLMSIGYDSSKITTAPTSYSDLLTPAYKNAVAIKGDPTQANEAASAVYLAALQSGGSVSNIQPGIDFFKKLKSAGNFISTLPTQATVASGETPVVIQWSFNNVAWGPSGPGLGTTGSVNPNWKVVIPTGTALGSYYNQTINKQSPNPAAARLWEEFLYTPKVQNLYLAAGAYPAMLTAMEANGTVDQSVLSSVGKPPANFVQLTATQATSAAALLTSNWKSAIG